MRTLIVLCLMTFGVRAHKVFASEDTLSVLPDLMITDPGTGGFGESVLLADVNGDGYDDLVVGERFADYAAVNQGEVQIYFSTGETIPTVPDQILIESDDFIYFGESVKAAGDVNNDGYEDVIVLAQGNEFGLSGNFILLYHGSPAGLVGPYDWIISVAEHAYTYSGTDVNMDGYQDVIISDPYSNEGATDGGSAKLYFGGATGLSTTPAWSALGQYNSEYYGSAVSVNDINLDGWMDIASGCGGVNDGVGRIEVFLGSPSGFSVTPSFVKYENYDGEGFGSVVNMEHDMNNDGIPDMLIAASYRIDGENTGAIDIFYGPFFTEIGSPDTTLSYAAYNSGSYYYSFEIADMVNDGYPDIIFKCASLNLSRFELAIISGTADGLSPLPVWVATVSYHYNHAFSVDGNYNGDEYPDILTYSGSEDFINIYTGKPFFPGLSDYAITFSTGYLQDNEFFGSAVSSTGDVNGDGVNDMITGSALKTYCHIGGSPEMDANPAWTYNLFQPGSGLGKSLKIINDLNEDGYDDVLVGAPDFDYAATSDGFVAVFKGRSTGVFPTPAWVKTGSATDYSYGHSVNSGDFNGDGHTDIIVGSPGGGTGYISRVYIYYGNGSIPDGTADLVLQNDGYYGFGYRISTGDVNGDAFTDVLITEDYTYLSHPSKVWLYYGGSTMDNLPDWSYSPIGTASDFGEWISMNGDYNADGMDDIAIGWPTYAGGQTDEGSIYLFYGSEFGPSASPDLQVEGNIVSEKIGSNFGSGDVNDDGFDDLIFIYPDFDAENYQTGWVRTLFGKASGLSPTSFKDIYVGGGSALNTKFIEVSKDADGDSIADIFIGHWYTSYSSRGYVTMHKGEPNSCTLLSDTSFVEVTDTSITVHWSDIGAVHYNARCRKLGTAVWTYFSTAGTFAYFDGLDSCTAYEVQLNAECGTSSGAWSTFIVHTVGCPIPCDLLEITSVDITGITGSSATVAWEDSEEALSYIFRYKQVSGTFWVEFELPVNVIVLATLTACTNYEVQIKSDCGADTSFWSESFLFSTTCGGCTSPVSGLYASPITTSGAKLHWIADPGASKYKVYYRQVGAGTWTIVNAHQNFRTLTGLLPATTYEYKVKSLCAVGVESDFSSTANFTTLPLRSSQAVELIMKILPSPNNGVFLVQYSGFTLPPTISIYALNGQLIHRVESDNLTEFKIELPQIEQGMYLIELVSGNTAAYDKFIVTH